MDPATSENLNYGWSPPATPQTRRLKVILPQCYAALALLAVNLSYAIFDCCVFPLAIPADTGSTPHITYGLITCIGLLAGGIVAQFTGARLLVIITGVVSIISWSVFLVWNSSLTVLRCVLYTVVLAKVMVQGPSYVYLAEISQPNMRSSFMATVCVTVKDGLVYFNLFNKELTIIHVYANIVLVLFGIVVIFFLPDSPYWLANKGRYHAVESSLAWFRGRTTAENVKFESKAIISNAQSSPTACKLFGHKSFYTAALIVGYVFLATAYVRMFYTAYVLHPEPIMSKLDFSDMSLVWGISIAFVLIAFIVLVGIIGKRIIILICLFAGIVAIFTTSIAGYLNTNDILNENVHSWFLLICTAVAYFSLIAGVISVPLILNGELFPSKLRNLGAGFGLFFVYVMQGVLYNLYSKYIPFSLGALLALFFVSLLCFISLLWLFPRTDNKSLVEIEQSCTSVSELTRKK